LSATSDGSEASDGRVLVDNVDGTTRLESELRLVCRTDGSAMDHVIGRITLFAFVASAIVGTLALSRVAPLPIGIIAMTWLIGAIVARGWSTRRLGEHGRFSLDFDRRIIEIDNPNGKWEQPLDSDVIVEVTDDDTPGEHARWLLLKRRGVMLRLARGTPEELGRVLYVLRKQGIKAPLG